MDHGEFVFGQNGLGGGKIVNAFGSQIWRWTKCRPVAVQFLKKARLIAMQRHQKSQKKNVVVIRI